ncbi:MAG: hypothetical protein LBD10_06160 [Desulfobulbus sp.]|uniref:hypothetical protein n=1 Tax=Desulfobulbus sp. TaxID=895 RepID=UPI0028505B2B|nr:hypothetical protein [Desulfobulbus sp.]MDR2549762.1 hypothetical protein [Desulfobulbus sp.]
MQLKTKMLLAGVALCGLVSVPVQAETNFVRPTKAQMQAIRACSAAKGVEFPGPRAERPPVQNEAGAGAPANAAAKDGQRKGYHRTKLTDEQRAIVDSCFKEQGLIPPPHRADRAENRPARPTKAQRQAIHACAAAKGVALPAPRAERLAQDNQTAGAPANASAQGGQGRGMHRPKLSEEQRAIVDSCFKEQGLTPPPHRR